MGAQKRAMICPSCNRPAPRSAVVCEFCSAALPPARVVKRESRTPGTKGRTQYRPLTVVFCDLVDSVALSQDLDAEDLLDLMDRYQSLCEEIVSDRGGYLAKFMGDGVLAYFGYPKADEDDSANAVNAGLDIIAAIREVGAERQIPLHVRVGIATGLVLVKDGAGPRAAAQCRSGRQDPQSRVPTPIRRPARHGADLRRDPQRDARLFPLSRCRRDRTEGFPAAATGVGSAGARHRRQPISCAAPGQADAVRRPQVRVRAAGARLVARPREPRPGRGGAWRSRASASRAWSSSSTRAWRRGWRHGSGGTAPPSGRTARSIPWCGRFNAPPRSTGATPLRFS